MRAFREKWKAGRKWRVLADEIGRIGRCLNNLVGVGLDITPNARGGFNFEARESFTRGGGVDLALLGIQIENDHMDGEAPAPRVKVLARRVILHKPADATSGFILSLPDSYLALADAPAAGLQTIYLNYDIDASSVAPTVGWEPGEDSAVRLYAVNIASGRAAVTRVYRPGDVDLEAVWLDYEQQEPEE